MRGTESYDGTQGSLIVNGHAQSNEPQRLTSNGDRGEPDLASSLSSRTGNMQRSVVVVGTLVWCSILVVVVFLLRTDYGLRISAGEHQVMAVSAVLGRSMRSAYAATTSVMRATADRVGLMGPDREDMDAYLENIAGQLRMVQLLLVVDGNGQVTADSRPDDGAVGLDVSDREYFQAHAAGESTDVHLSRPITSRVDGRPALPVSLAVRGDDGRLLAVVVAGVEPEYFRGLFRTLSSETRLDAALFRTDGSRLAVLSHKSDMHVRPAPGVDLFPQVVAHSESPVSHLDRGLADGPAIVSHRRLDCCPAIVVCSLPRAEALSEFWPGLWRCLLVLAIVALVLLVGGRVQTRQARQLASQAEALSVTGAELEQANRRLAERVREQRLTEAALRDSEKLFREAVDNYPAAFFIYDANRRIRFVNSRGMAVTGLHEEDMLGHRDEEIHPPDVAGQYVPLLERAMANRSVETERIPLSLVTGKYTFDFMFVPLCDGDGHIREVLGIAHDVTEREQAEEARRTAENELEKQRLMRIHSDRLRSLGQMAAGIAHELNQPLVGVRGMAEHHLIALQRGWDLPPDKLEYRLRTIIEQADRMTHIIRHVRMFAREAGKPEVSRVDINAVVLSANDMLGAQFASRAIDLELQLGEDLPVVLANPFSLEEVLINLLVNARDAVESRREQSADAAARVSVRTEHGPEKPMERVILTVIDSGVGMSADELDRAFDPFYTTKQPDKGTGLGLSICRSIVEQFGGTIDLKSTIGRGTVVTVSLPAARKTAET